MTSNYRVGTGIYEITDPAIGLQMQGFADNRQKTTGVESSLFSRAFIVEDQTTGMRVVIVSADIWACTNVVKQAVVNRLQLQFGTLIYTSDNVLISGTHTHSAPGGYAGYELYDLTGKGFDPNTFQCIVSGILTSIRKAHNNLGPGKIYVNKGDIEDCGRNRSRAAYLSNPQSERDRYPNRDTDKEMLLLKFTKLDSSGRERPIGVLTWFAIHPTDRGQNNGQVCGDSKGYASALFETSMNMDPLVPETFVAAFANASAGDVSGNVEFEHIPNGIDDIQHMQKHGNQQYEKAKQLFDSASEELSGSIDCRHTYVDMSCVLLEDILQGERTWPAALGLSFAAGSTEDGVPWPPSGLREGITMGDIAKNPMGTEALMLGVASWAGHIAEKLPFGAVWAISHEEIITGHLPKPILFAVGAREGLAPKILPLQIFRIGQLVIIGVPAELTTMAGRRLRETVLNELPSMGVQHLAIACYANDYSQYVTTTEEYIMQHYEGASTLFGPYTLQAYQQEFRKLAIALENGNRVTPGPLPPGNSSPSAGRWTFRNLSTEVALNYYYKSFDDRVDFIRKGDEPWYSPHPATFEPIKIPAGKDFAFPKGLTDTFNKTYTTATLSIAGTQKSFTIGDLVTITGGGIEVTEYKPPTRKIGIGGYDLLDGRDQAFAFDYTGSGKLDHLFLYRPGEGSHSIIGSNQRHFVTVYSGYPEYEKTDGELRCSHFRRASNIRGFALDPWSHGRLNHIVFYASGNKTFGPVAVRKIAKTQDGYEWEATAGPSTTNCDFSDSRDKAFAFDYDGNGYVNHVVVYRPGTGKIWILGPHTDGFHFEERWQSQHGIVGFDLLDERDLGLAFDYEGSGKLDHLVFYRPGTGIVCIVKNDPTRIIGGADPIRFWVVYDSRIAKVAGIASCDLSSPSDRIIAFDYASTSRPGYYFHDHLVCYRPGTGRIWIIKRKRLENEIMYSSGTFETLFNSDTGIGTYDLKSASDQILAFDYKGDDERNKLAAGSGASELFLFRPGSGAAFIVKKSPKYLLTVPQWYDLRLESLRTKDSVTQGRNLIVVAAVGPQGPNSMNFASSLRIRVFDSDGNMVVDKPESKLVRAERFTALKEKLKALKLFDPAIEMTLRGVLLEGKWATEVELDKNRDWRKILINAIIDNSNTTYWGPNMPGVRPAGAVSWFGQLDDHTLIGTGAVIVFLQGAGISDRSALQRLTIEKQRAALAQAIHNHSGRAAVMADAMGIDDETELVGLPRQSLVQIGLEWYGGFRREGATNVSQEDKQIIIGELACIQSPDSGPTFAPAYFLA